MRFVRILLAACSLSLIFHSLYLIVSRQVMTRYGQYDYLSIIVSTLAGSSLLLLLPVRIEWRICVLAIYQIPMGVALFWYSFFFLGVVYGLWL